MYTSLAIANLSRHFRGRLIFPGDCDYDSARRVHNGAVVRSPALIAQCETAEDVCRAVEFARDNSLTLAVRSGGHSQTGFSVCDGGLLIDLSPSKRITVDPRRRVVSGQTGLRAGEVDRATQTFGLATIFGQCPSVGIGGISTGGGFGWLTGKYGLTCDNTLSAQMVTADARVVTASAECNADLFWAIRGGGGNYGVAYEIAYRLHPVDRVVGGMLWYPLSHSRAAFELMQAFLHGCPDELTVSFGIRPVEGQSAFVIALCYCGESGGAERLMAPINRFAQPLGGSIRSLSYLEMQSETGEPPPGACYYARGGFMRGLSAAAIDCVIASSQRNRSEKKLILFDHYHGEMCRVAQGETAFAVREPGFGFLVQAEWRDSADARDQRQWVDQTMDALAPFAADIAYSANLGDEGHDRVRRCYGPNYSRLSEIKRKYDPDNLFRMNHNILPSAENINSGASAGR